VDRVNNRVGLGISTPSQLLQLLASNPKIFIQSIANGSNGILFGRGSTTEDAGLLYNVITNGDLGIYTGGVTSASARLYVDEAGNVGIGTTNPLAKLHIANTGDESTTIVNNDSRFWKYGVWDFGTGADNFFIEDKGATGAGSNVRFVIDTNGNVGIGTTSPTATLDINAISGGSLYVMNGATHIFQVISNGDVFMNTNQFVIKGSADGKCGIGTDVPTSKLHVIGLQEFTGNATALVGGLTAGAFYRTGEFLKVVY